jgi:hypothetical protein
MAQWRITPVGKNQLLKENYRSKVIILLIIETGWRWGDFETETEDEDIPEIESGTDLWNCDYHVELVETFDGCWEEHYTDECDEETQQWLEEFLGDNSYFDLEEHGWNCGDTEMIIDCGPI